MEQTGYKTRIQQVDSIASLAIALKDKHDIVISEYNDCRFPVLEALNTVNGRCPGLPFILIADNIPEDILVKLVQAGVHDFVKKGYFKRLAQVILRELRTSAKEQYSPSNLNDLLLTVGRVNRLIAEISDEISLLQAICTAITEEPQFKIAWIGYVQDNSFETRPVTYSGQDQEYGPSFFRATWDDTGTENSVTGTAIKNRQISILRNITKEDNTQPWRQSMVQELPASAISLPLKVYDKIIGALTICSVYADAFTEEDVDLLAEMAGDISLGIQNLRQRVELQKNEEQLRLQSMLLETSMDSVMVHDMNGKLVYTNPVAYTSRGYSGEEFSILEIKDLVAPDSRKDIPTMSERRQTGLSNFETLHVRKDGSIMPVEVISSVMEFNGQPVVVSTTRDITARKHADQQLRDSYKQLQQTFAGVTQAISATVELRDPYTAGHQLRVARLSNAIAREMGLSEEVAGQIYTAGLIHDIGKISVPAEILSKPGKLSKIEFSLIQMHPQAGYEILKNIDFPFPVARWVLEHHEFIDGSGYPSGLTGDQICLESKILVIADTVEAILSHRPYRPSLGTEAALNQISTNKDKIYDGTVVDACLRLFKEKGYHLE